MHDEFPKPIPQKPQKKKHIETPTKPDKKSKEFVPWFTYIELIFKSKQKKKIAEYESENFHKQKVEYEQPYNFAGGDRFTLKDDGATY